MFKPYLLLPFLLSSGIAVATTPPASDEPMIKGDITKAQFMERAEKRFARRDTNGDGILQVAEKEAAMAKMHEMMKQAGKTPSDKMAKMKPMHDTTKAQYMERQEKIFGHMDKNADGVLSEAERSAAKDKMKQHMQDADDPAI